ncbi:hypothetical protein AKJ09_01560 [Labilithrix luteola]|uniref:Uncharacterized protein n=1 Tax=Labilithrix luteola TaxID=1391654 RepID=A0A0K1PNC6_9BACT|nr:hypothetical protein [Labilithrix luteola]AKU94896.1 hypothetical protein AKJ09_01560 [Labilithrix luteola]
MSRSSFALAACLLVGQLCGAQGEAHATERSLHGLDLDYVAPAECPSREQFDAMLRARLPDEATTKDTRHFLARITPDEAGGYVGRLDVRGPGLAPDVREIHAPTCRAVSTSLVLFVVLALTPASQAEHEPERTSPAPPPPSPPTTEPAPLPTRSSSDETRSYTHAAKPAATWSWSAGFQATYQHMSEAAWGGRVHAELTRVPALGPLGASLRLSYGWSDFSTFPVRAGEAKFRLRTGRLEGCARVALGSFALSPCAAFELGSLDGRTPALSATEMSTLWAAPGVRLRLGWQTSAWLALEVEAGLSMPLERRVFQITDPIRTVYEPPAVVVDLGAGLGVSGRFR